LRSATVFDTLTVEVGTEREAILARAASAGINLRTTGPTPWVFPWTRPAAPAT
jgi:glycine cleavage system pyridoxal-binding protein P